MAKPVDLADYEESSPAPQQQQQQQPQQQMQQQQQQQPQQQQQMPAGPQKVDLNEFDSPLPWYANGLNPKLPITQSPLSVDERKVLSEGNKLGNIKYLQKRFESVQEDDDGNLLVRNNGLWHKVDGNAFDNVDAHTATKGILNAIQSVAMRLGDSKSMASSAPTSKFMGKQAARTIENSDPVAKELTSELVENKWTAASVIGGLGAAAMTGGASIPLQAAAQGLAAGSLELGRTSLGRLEGTYSATPEEQLKDVGLELLFNAAGAVIPAGVKKSTDWFADHVFDIGKAMKAGGAVVRGKVKAGYAMMTDTTGDAIDTITEKGERVSQVMKIINRRAGGDGKKFADEVMLAKTDFVKRIAEEAEKLPGEIYRARQSQLVNAVGDSFNGNIDDILDDVLGKAVNDGFVTVRTKAVYRAVGDKAEVVKAARVLSPADVMEMLSTNGGKLPKDVIVEAASYDKLAKFIRTSGETADAFVGFDKEAYKYTSDFFDSVIRMRGIRARSGAAGAEQVLDMHRVLGDLTYKLSQGAKDANVGVIGRKMAQFHEALSTGIGKRFEAEGAGNMFVGLNSTYSSVQKELLPILSAAKRADGKAGDAAFEQLTRRLSSKAGLNTQAKQGFEAVLDIAQKNKTGSVDKVMRLQDNLRIYQAAEEFNPWVPKSKLGHQAMKGLIVTGTMGIVTANPLPIMANVGLASAASPRVGFNAIRGLDAAWTAKEQLTKLPKQALRTVYKNPAASAKVFDATFDALLGSMQAEEQVKSQLLAPIKGGQ